MAILVSRIFISCIFIGRKKLLVVKLIGRNLTSLLCSKLCTRLCSKLCSKLCTRLCSKLCARLCLKLCTRLCLKLCTRLCLKLCTRLFSKLCTRLCSKLYTLYTSLCLIISKILLAKSPFSSLSPLYCGNIIALLYKKLDIGSWSVLIAISPHCLTAIPYILLYV